MAELARAQQGRTYFVDTPGVIRLGDAYVCDVAASTPIETSDTMNSPTFSFSGFSRKCADVIAVFNRVSFFCKFSPGAYSDLTAYKWQVVARWGGASKIVSEGVLTLQVGTQDSYVVEVAGPLAPQYELWLAVDANVGTAVTQQVSVRCIATTDHDDGNDENRVSQLARASAVCEGAGAFDVTALEIDVSRADTALLHVLQTQANAAGAAQFVVEFQEIAGGGWYRQSIDDASALAVVASVGLASSVQTHVRRLPAINAYAITYLIDTRGAERMRVLFAEYGNVATPSTILAYVVPQG